MAHLVRPWIVSYTTPEGKRCKKTTAGAIAKKYRAKKWYGTGITGMPPTKRVPLAANRTAALRMLDDLCRRAEQGHASVPDREAGRAALEDHLKAFERDLARGLASRGKRRRTPSPKQVKLAVQRVRDVFVGCGFTHPADLGNKAPGIVADYLQARVGKPVKEGGFGHQTAAFFLAAVRRFVWWMSKQRVPVRADLFDDVPGFDPSNNRVHARRNFTSEELARILDSALSSTRPVRDSLTGRERYFLYLTAFSTGFRSSELASLQPGNFLLDGDPPVVTLSSKRAKNKKAAYIPLTPAVATQLRGFLADKPAGQPIWQGRWHIHGARMLRNDLEAAGVPYTIEGADGVLHADFHSLRHSFVTALADAGVSPKELQILARHSDPRLTLAVYTHTSSARLSGAVGLLPSLGGERSPFADMTREQLEIALAVAQGMVRFFYGTAGGKPVQADVQAALRTGTNHLS